MTFRVHWLIILIEYTESESNIAITNIPGRESNNGMKHIVIKTDKEYAILTVEPNQGKLLKVIFKSLRHQPANCY